MTGRFKNGKYGILSYLPIVKLSKYWELLEELGNILKQKKDVKDLRKKIQTKLSTKETKIWHLEVVQSQISALKLSEKSSLMLKEIWKSEHNEEFECNFMEEIFRLMDNFEHKLKIDISSFESKVATFKILDMTESGPQLILQASLIFMSPNELLKFNIVDYPFSASIKILQILTSFGSLVFGTFNVFKTSIYNKIDQKDQIMPQYSKKSQFLIFLSILITIAPRLATLCIFFGSFQGFPGMITLLIFTLVYIISFASFTLCTFKKLKGHIDSVTYIQSLLQALFSAHIGPCVVLNPKTRTFLYSSFASAFAHLLLLLYLIIFCDSEKHLTVPSLIGQEYFKIICYTLLGLLVFSSIFSLILHCFSKKSFQCKLCCFNCCQSESTSDEFSLQNMTNSPEKYDLVNVQCIVENSENNQMDRSQISSPVMNELKTKLLYKKNSP